MAEYANRKSDQVESLVILWVQFPPRSFRSRGQTARHQPDMLETMVQLHPGLFAFMVCRCFGSTPPW